MGNEKSDEAIDLNGEVAVKFESRNPKMETNSHDLRQSRRLEKQGTAQSR
jgi:hypothetical protein